MTERVPDVYQSYKAGPEPGTVPDVYQSFKAEQQAEEAEQAALKGPGLREEIAALDAQTAAAAQHEAALEARHGAFGSAGMHYARGILGAVLAPGALAGAGAESLGSATGWKGLEDFGRGLGESASGQAAMEAAAFLLGSAVGDQQEGLSDYERMRRDVQESQQAWPMLSTLSNMAGMATTAILTGGSTAATTLGGKAAAMGAVGAVEGAGGGAQVAYEQSAPLRDVLSSTVVGAVLGGGLGAGVAGLGGAAARGFANSGGLDSIANRKALQAFGAQGSDLKALVKEFGVERLDEMGARLRKEVGIGGLTEALEGRAGRLSEVTEKAGADIGDILRKADELGAPDAPKILTRMQAHVDELKSGLGPEKRLGQKIEEDYLTPLVEQINARGTLTFREIADFRVKVDQAVKKVDHIERKNLRPFRDVVQSSIDDAVESVGGDLAGTYKTARRRYQDLIRLNDIADERVGSLAGNRSISLSDTVSTVGGMAAGGPLGGLASGLANAAVRKYGDAGAVKLIDAFQKLGRGGVSVQRVGGREAKEVIDQLGALKDGVRKAVAGAGDNPEVRYAAEKVARETAAAELSKAAGRFNPAKWDRDTITPVQKVLHRTDILNQASNDLAADFGKVSALRPPVDFDLDPGRLGKLLSDADGPEAIGGLMARVQSLAGEAPPTPLGAQLRYALGQARQALSSADLPQSMAEGHRLLRGLSAAAQSAPDDLSRAYAARAATELQNELTGEAFGSAGQLYRQLRGNPSAFEALGSPELLRNALRTTAERGKLPQLVAQHNAELEQALLAAKKLGANVSVKGLQKQLKALEDRFARAEEAVTLDGGPIARVLDFFEGGLDGKMAASVAPGASLETMVGDTVRTKMETLLPVLRPPAKGRYRPAATRVAAAVTARLTTAEQHELYRDRVKLLADMQEADASEIAGQAMEGMPPGTPAELAGIIGQDYQQKLANLARDIPRPKPDIRGKAFETLSSDQVRLANAMWEATTEPLSVFDDFKSGMVDYDKVQYAWQQYPGLQQAAQLALVDAFQEHLSDGDKANVPDGTITQLDYLLGFGGTLQSTLEPGFSGRMDAIGAQVAQQQQQQQAQNALELPGSKPTYTERVGGAIA